MLRLFIRPDRTLLLGAALALLGVGLWQLWKNDSPNTVTVADDKVSEQPMLAHNVFFKLKESTPAARKKLIDACHKYLADHPGTVFYAAGAIGEEFNREVNDQDWDVGLHVVFDGKESHDKYQDAPTHIKFIEENRADWAKVRVFDSYVTKP